MLDGPFEGFIQQLNTDDVPPTAREIECLRVAYRIFTPAISIRNAESIAAIGRYRSETSNYSHTERAAGIRLLVLFLTLRALAV